MDKSKLITRIRKLEKQVATGNRLRREVERNYQGAAWVIKTGIVGAGVGVLLIFGLGLLPGVVLLFTSGVVALVGGFRQNSAVQQLDDVEEGLIEYKARLAESWAQLMAG